MTCPFCGLHEPTSGHSCEPATMTRTPVSPPAATGPAPMPEGCVYLPCAPGYIHQMPLEELRQLLATQGLHIWKAGVEDLEDVPLSKAADESLIAEAAVRGLHIVPAASLPVLEKAAALSRESLERFGPVYSMTPWCEFAWAELARRQP